MPLYWNTCLKISWEREVCSYRYLHHKSVRNTGLKCLTGRIIHYHQVSRGLKTIGILLNQGFSRRGLPHPLPYMLTSWSFWDGRNKLVDIQVLGQESLDRTGLSGTFQWAHKHIINSRRCKYKYNINRDTIVQKTNIQHVAAINNRS